MFQPAQQPIGAFKTFNQGIALWASLIKSLWPEALAFSFFNTLPTAFRDYAPQASTGLFMGVFAICMLIGIVFLNALYTRIYHAMRGNSLTHSQSIATGLLYWPKVTGASVIIIVATAALFGILLSLKFISHTAVFAVGVSILWVVILLGIIILFPYLCCILPSILIDNKNSWTGITHSFRLVHRHWLFSASVFWLSVILCGILNVFAWKIFHYAGSLIAGIFVTSLQACIIISLYHQLSLRQPTT